MKSTFLVAHEYGGPEVLELIETELPALAPGLARVQVRAAGINPIDARRMTGEFKHSSLPQTFGSEFAGTIVEVADDVSDWAIGDEVLGSGGGVTHATVIDVPVDTLVRRPANVDWDVAGSIAGAAQTAMTIVDELGDIGSVLVHGASGGVGSVFVQLAKERGIDVVATASAQNQDYLRSLGAVPVVYGDGLLERVKEVHPEPFDASIDMSGTDSATDVSLAVVKPDGIIASIAGKKPSSPRVQAMWVKRNPKNLQHVVDGIAKGAIKWEVSKEFPFSEAREAYASILNGHTRGKSVLRF